MERREVQRKDGGKNQMAAYKMAQNSQNFQKAVESMEKLKLDKNVKKIQHWIQGWREIR